MYEEVNRKLQAMNTTVHPLHRPWALQCTALQIDRQTDGQHCDANSLKWMTYVHIVHAIVRRVEDGQKVSHHLFGITASNSGKFTGKFSRKLAIKRSLK